MITFLALFVGFAVLYQLSLSTIGVAIPEYPKWMYSADNREGILRGIDHLNNHFSMAKHPLFAVVGRPLFNLGLTLYGGVGGPTGVNLALILPMAVCGGLAVGLMYLTFARPGEDRRVALLFALLYGTASAPWLFASFPDTYAITALPTALFLFALFRIDTEDSMQIALLAGANALACWGSPQQMFLSVIPGVHWLLRHGVSRTLVVRVATYSVALALLWAVPYFLYLKIIGFGFGMPHRYVQENLAWAVGYVGTVPMSLLVFGIIGPTTEPGLFTDPSFAVLGAAPWWWWLVAAVFAAFVVNALRAAVEREPPRFLLGMLAFLLIYCVFFMAFNPGESYLMAMTCAGVWVAALHDGYVHRRPRVGPRVRTWLLPLLLVTVFASNAALVASVRARAIAMPEGYPVD